MAKKLGTVRQSAVVMNYGPGAIIDFRLPGSGAATSVVSAGLEEWESQFRGGQASAQDMRRLKEHRLAEKLKVSHFRMPPIHLDDKRNDEEELRSIPLTGVRFPQWLQCPRCSIIRPARSWKSEPGRPERSCAACSKKAGNNVKVYVVPVRFVLACRNGHLDEFPWSDWVHRDKTCPNGNHNEFRLETRGAGLAGLHVSCPKCGARNTMESAFTAEAHRGRLCSGARPWLAEGTEECRLHPMTLQRGASNLYFPEMESALVIPPWSETVIKKLGYRWHQIASIKTNEEREQYVEMFWHELEPDFAELGKAGFKALVNQKAEEAECASSGDLRWDEYRQFILSQSSAVSRSDDFELRHEAVPPGLPLARLIRVPSLREFRVLKSFTRIEPKPGKPPVKTQFLSQQRLGWLPAIEVRGEGIFLSLDMERLKEWEARPAVVERARAISCYQESRTLEGIEVQPGLGARFLLLHSLAHALMKQLSLQCGYSSASLRERLYVGDGDRAMAGLMIYTATSDADGTLGGLQRQGHTDRFLGIFRETIRANIWCSSDPLCINGVIAATESANLSVCHSCLQAPETSCEEFNRFLDRALLVGTPEDRALGFFSDLTE